MTREEQVKILEDAINNYGCKYFKLTNLKLPYPPKAAMQYIPDLLDKGVVTIYFKGKHGPTTYEKVKKNETRNNR